MRSEQTKTLIRRNAKRPDYANFKKRERQSKAVSITVSLIECCNAAGSREMIAPTLVCFTTTDEQGGDETTQRTL